jgi:predicted nuclease of predicted toxin-antitoxin system
MNLLADENIESEIIDLLRDNGFNVDYIMEVSPGADDDYVIQKANKNNSVLLTSDKDFGELVINKDLIGGIVLINPDEPSVDEKANNVLNFLKRYKKN